MQEVASILYCRSVFQDFRKPVELMYPTLAKTYSAIIKKPMDLGTILLKTMKNQQSVEEFRENLKLVHHNALTFNEGSSMMEAISNHLELVSAGLFEEILRKPYYPQAGTTIIPASGTVASHTGGAGAAGIGGKFDSKAHFSSLRLENRKKRLMLVYNEPMTSSEIRRLVEILQSVMSNNGGIGTTGMGIPTRLKADVEQIVQIMLNKLALSNNNNVNNALYEEEDVPLSLRSLLLPLLNSSTDNKYLSIGVEDPAAVPIVPCTNAILDVFILRQQQSQQMGGLNSHSHHRLYSDCVYFLQYLDEAIGVLLVLMQDRSLCGTPYSGIWARPAGLLLWAQSSTNASNAAAGSSGGDTKNRSPYWPCMLIASGNKTPPRFQMSAEVMNNNLRRIPIDTAKQLLKLRPRGTNSAAGQQYATGASTTTDAGSGMLVMRRMY